MNDVIELDLHKAFRVLLPKRLWIIGFSLLAGLIVFVFFISQPEMYEATAVVTISNTRFHPSIETDNQTEITEQVDNKFALDIAQSQEIVGLLYDAWSDPKKERYAPFEFFEKNLTGEAGNSSKVIRLSVRLQAKEEAERLANMWAEKLAERIEEIYAEPTESQLAIFEAQVQSASADLESSQNALVEFEGRNKGNALKAELDALLQQQKDYLYREQVIASIQRDARALLKEVNGLQETSPISTDIQTRWLALQLRQYSSISRDSTISSSSGDLDTSSITIVSPVAYQIPSTNEIQPVNVADFHNSIQVWLTALDEQSAEIKKLLADYPQNLVSLQQQIELLNTERNRINLEASAAAELYLTLKRYQDTYLVTKDSVNTSRTIAQVFAIDKTGLIGSLAYSLIALATSAALAAAFFLIQDWWLRSDDAPESK